jgi:hypothetical protein
MEASEKEKQEIIRKRQPFNFGIKELKRVLDRMDMPKAEKNRTIRMYKERLYTRVDEVRAKMEEKLKLPETTGEDNATNK